MEIAKLTSNKVIMLHYIPDLGLTEQERMGLINWSESKVKATGESVVVQRHLARPIDAEAMPYPKAAAPKLMNMLVRQLPDQW